MKTYGEVDIQINIFLTLAFGGEWSASRPGRFTPDTHWIGGWVGPKAGLDNMKRKFLTLMRFELWPLSYLTLTQLLYWLYYSSSLRWEKTLFNYYWE
jgi:hypothetical protein